MIAAISITVGTCFGSAAIETISMERLWVWQCEDTNVRAPAVSTDAPAVAIVVRLFPCLEQHAHVRHVDNTAAPLFGISLEVKIKMAIN